MGVKLSKDVNLDDIFSKIFTQDTPLNAYLCSI